MRFILIAQKTNHMITNFEEITKELNEKELELIPFLVKGFQAHQKTNPIKAPEIVKSMNIFLQQNGYKIKLSEPRLRKCCNYIRSHSILPLMATSDGYFVSFERESIESQINSLLERSNSIKKCAEGLAVFIAP